MAANQWPFQGGGNPAAFFHGDIVEMARRTYARGSRRTSRPARSSYRAASPRKSYRSRSTGRRSTARRGSASARTIRIEIVQPTQSAISRPDMIGMKVAPAKRKATM